MNAYNVSGRPVPLGNRSCRRRFLRRENIIFPLRQKKFLKKMLIGCKVFKSPSGPFSISGFVDKMGHFFSSVNLFPNIREASFLIAMQERRVASEWLLKDLSPKL